MCCFDFVGCYLFVFWRLLVVWFEWVYGACVALLCLGVYCVCVFCFGLFCALVGSVGCAVLCVWYLCLFACYGLVIYLVGFVIT